MKKTIINTLKFLVFLGAGIFLFWLIYKDQDVEALKKDLSNINYFWILFSVLFLTFSHAIRALRWQMMIKPLGYTSSFLNAFFAVLITYFANLAVPRLGEVSRPTILKKYEKIPFGISFGTIVLERIIDVLFLLLLTVFVALTQAHVILRFLDNEPFVKEKIQAITNSNFLYYGLLTGVLLLIMAFTFRRYFSENVLYQKIKSVTQKFFEGLRSISKVPNKSLFLFYSIIIWLCYFLMLLFSFYAFDILDNISWIAVLTIFVMGSYGMVAPVQGGIGAWHFMVAGTLIVYGINDQDARVVALVVHTLQTLMVVVLGLISTVLLPIVNSKKDEKNTSESPA